MEKNKAKETYSRIGLSYILLYFCYLVVMAICYIVYSRIAGKEGLQGDANIIINYAVRVGLLYPAMYLAIRKLPKFDIQKNKLGFGGILTSICITYATMILFNIVGILINNFIGKYTGLGNVNPLIDALGNISPVVQVVVVTILAPICEELLFRKFIIDRVVNYGEVTAMLVSALMFGLYHGNLAQFVYAFGIGIFFAFIYLRTGKIWYTILFHMFVNGFSTTLTLILSSKINLSEFMDLYYSGDMEKYNQYVMEHIDVFATLGLFSMFIFMLVIAGIILMIVFHKKFVFQHHEEEIPKGQRFSTAILNVGMLVFIAYWLFSIISVQLGFSLFDSIVGRFL